MPGDDLSPPLGEVLGGDFTGDEAAVPLHQDLPGVVGRDGSLRLFLRGGRSGEAGRRGEGRRQEGDLR